MAYLIFYLTNPITRDEGDVFTKNERYFFHIFVILDMIATTEVLMMRLSYKYTCRAPLNIYKYFFYRVIFYA